MTVLERLRELDSSERTFEAGERLFRVGDDVSVLHLVEDGEAHLVRHRADGGALVLQRAVANTVLAEASIFSEGYHCDGLAVKPTRTVAIASSAVRQLLGEDPGFADSWAVHLSRELQATRLRAEILSLKTVRERLDAWLVWHGDVPPAQGMWKSVAYEIGTSPEALYRELSRRRSEAARA